MAPGVAAGSGSGLHRRHPAQETPAVVKFSNSQKAARTAPPFLFLPEYLRHWRRHYVKGALLGCGLHELNVVGGVAGTVEMGFHQYLLALAQHLRVYGGGGEFDVIRLFEIGRASCRERV